MYPLPRRFRKADPGRRLYVIGTGKASVSPQGAGNKWFGRPPASSAGALTPIFIPIGHRVPTKRAGGGGEVEEMLDRLRLHGRPKQRGTLTQICLMSAKLD